MKLRRMARRWLTALLALGLLTGPLAPAALASFKAEIYTDTKVYNIPSTAGRGMDVPRGLTVTVMQTSGNWAKISCKGNSAYIQIPYLNLVNRPTAYAAKATPVYSQPSASSAKLGTLAIGAKVYVVNKVNGYYRVQNSAGSVTGYIRAGNLTTKAKLTAAYNAYKKQQAGVNGTTLYAFLKSLLGRPYSANASLASAPNSFNCSTLVCYVMGKCGISMKGTAAQQARDDRYARITDPSALRAGDVLCFDENSDGVCDHVAIYLGKGIFIEASRKAGKVQLNSADSWYASHFMWARRP